MITERSAGTDKALHDEITKLAKFVWDKMESLEKIHGKEKLRKAMDNWDAKE